MVTLQSFPALTLRHSALTLGRSALTLCHSALTPGRPALTLGRPALTLGRSALTLGRSALTLCRFALTLGRSALTLCRCACAADLQQLEQQAERTRRHREPPLQHLQASLDAVRLSVEHLSNTVKDDRQRHDKHR